ncbi:MAG: beta strand repeat-containing protein, partial [Phycisphaerae bacterium]
MSNRQERAKRVAGQRQFRRLAAKLFPRGFALAASIVGLTGAMTAHAANDLFWDTNGAATGSGDPTGTWGTDLFWNSDPLGEAAGTFSSATANINDLHFSAGTNGTAGTVTVSGDVLANSIRFDNDVALTLSGGNTITLGGGAVGNSGIVVAAGTTAANTINTPLVFLDPSTTIQNNGGGTLTLGTVGGPVGVVNSGSGTGGVSVGTVLATVGAITQNSATSHLTLTGINSSTAGIHIIAGKVIAANDTTLGGTGNVITLNGGALQMNTTGFNIANNRVIKIGANGATFVNNATTGNFNVMGVISDVAPGAGALFITGTGTTIYVPAAQNTYTGGTHLGTGTITVINADSVGSASTANLVSGGLGVGTVFFDGGRMRSSTGVGSLIGNAIEMTADTTFATGGNKALTFTGPMTLVGGTRTIVQQNPAQDVAFNGIIGDGGNGYGLTLGAGTTGPLVLGGANTYTGPTSVNAGTLVLNTGGTIANSSAVNVATAGAGATLTVRGSKTFAGALTVGGNATVANTGTLNMQDGTVNSITLTGTSGLVLGGAAAGDASLLNIDLGPGGNDSIVLSGAAPATINAGGAKLGINVLVGYTGGPNAVITSPTTDLTTQAGAVTLDTSTGNFGGYSLGLVTTANAVTLTGTKVTATPNTLYFKGGIDGKWNTFTGGNTNNSNWTTDAAGTTDAKSDAGANTDVHFSAAGFTVASQATTLNQNYSIKSLTMDAAATTAVSIAPGTPAGTLTIGTGGINTQTGSAALTVSAPVTLGATQTWTHGSAATMTVSGAVGGTADLILTRGNAAGGTMVISGAVNLVGTITRDATNAAAQDQITGVIGAGVTAITQNNPNATSSLVLDGNNTALNATITVNAGRLDGRNTVAGNTIRAFGTGQINLNGGTLDARALGTGSFQVVVTGNGTVGNNVQLGGDASIDVQRTSGTTAVGNLIVFNDLSASAGKVLTVTGTNQYGLAFAGTTTIGTGGATLNPTTAPLNLAKVSAGANALTITGAGTTRLLNTATGAAANDITGTITVNGGNLTGYAQAAGAAPGAGSNSLGTATIALTSSNSVLRLAPAFNGGLTAAASAGLIDKSYVSGATLTSLALTNFLGATSPTATGGGQNLTGVQTVANLNVPVGPAPIQTSHQYTGLINITTAGVYNFSHRTDDGGNLFIDGHPAIVTANTTVANSFFLTAGLHTLTSRWNNNAGNGAEILSFQGPDTANALVVVPASAFFNTTAAAMATNFGNNVAVAAGTSPTIEIASDTTLGSLTTIGTGAGTGLNVNGSGDVNTLTFGGAVTLTDHFTLNNPTAHVVFNGGLLAAGGNNFTVTKNGFGTLTVNGPVQANGGFIVNAGLVNVTGTGTIGSPGAPVNLNNGSVIDLSGTSQNLGALSGTGTIQNGTITSTTLTKEGPGTVTLGATATPTTVVVRQGQVSITSNPATASTLRLDFGNTFSPATNMVSPTANLVLGGTGTTLAGGGAIALQGKNSTSNSQTFAGTLVDGGASSIVVTAAGTPGTVVLNAGPVTRNTAGTLDVTLPAGTQSATNGVVTSTGTDGQILTIGNTAFATVGGNSWAAKSTVSPGNVVDLAVAGAGGASGYTVYAGGALTGNADITASFVAPNDQTVDSLRFNAAAGATLTLGGTNVVSTGGILFGSTSTAANTITGGTIAPGAGQELVVISNKPNLANVISSVLTNGASGATTVTYRGNPNGGTTGALFTVGANNTYTGPTYITSGKVQVTTGGITTPFGTGANAIVYINGNTDGQFFFNQNATIANPFVIVGTGFNEAATRRGAIRLDSTATITPTLSNTITLVGDASIGNAAAITAAGSALISGNILTSNAAGATSFALTKVATGVIRLTGTNTQTAT